MDNYERIDRELIHKGVIIDYYQDTMKIPNGTTAKWDFIKHKGAAAVVAVKDLRYDSSATNKSVCCQL